ncbi:alpha/beta hydrolase domain-containing protein [Granulicella sibirica]|uniref:Alpha/beta hydrolase domain-containing protein n=1 Tax=Granulicella sibirica TaxID=2479048 RepID=A0A4Q0T874_9BACT|nr:alpha/beta hydrolase domain-containing protein [Granulicella sibirica]RXH58930.1 hypothetical protein GRAN_2240 [Granulicella sibirica]
MLKRLTTLALFTLTVAAQARIVRVELKPAPAEVTRDVPATYRVLSGYAYGEVDPHDPHNRIIQDIDHTPLNPRGMVEYTATFTLYAPLHPSPKAVLFYDVVNRGSPALPREYANGDFFLVSGWQGDIPFEGRTSGGGHAETIRVPIARNPDGSPITGSVFARFMDEPAGRETLALAHSITYGANDLPPTPVDLDTTHAHLITRKYEDIDGAVAGQSEIPPTDWSWADCETGTPDPAKICLKQGADPALLYELRYTAKDPLVMGLGFAAVRDLNAFLMTSPGGEGFENPVAGHARAAIAAGVSQSGNFLRSFLNLGFNEDESGHIVFAGLMPIISARQVPLNVRFGVPGGTSMLFEIGTDGANWYAPTPDPIRHNPTAGELDRCTATHTCPKIIELLGSAEFYSLRASMGFVGTTAAADLPLPANVRRFYFAGTTHGGGPGGFSITPHPLANCTLPANPNPETPTRRALILALRQWVVDDTAPPDNIYPTLQAKTLAPAAQVLSTFPRIPGAPLPHDVFNPNLIYALGPEFRANDLSGIAPAQPLTILGATPAVLPTLDPDGNEIGGIHSPLQDAPLGTYTGWNPVNGGFRKGQFCSLTGGYIPFPATAAERSATHDPRPSLEERYPTHAAYVTRVRTAAEALVKQRLLLPDDAEKLIHQAEQAPVPR